MQLIHARYAGRKDQNYTELLLGRQILAAARGQLKQQRRSLAAHLRKTKCRAKRQGYALGLKHAQQELAKLKLAQLSDLKAYQARLLQALKDDCVKLIIEVTKQILGSDTKRKPASVLKRLERALKQLNKANPEAIFLNPKQLETLLPELQRTFGSNVDFQADPCLAFGNARIETKFGLVELCWQDHLEQIRRLLNENLELCKDA
jgi:flagellar biosynthesis/type III secretory pathway protein FliH